MSNLAHIKELINEHQIEIIDLRFTGILGKWHSFSFNVEFALEFLETGVSFDGSSIPGWRKINNSDMIMKPDLSTAFIDPVTTYPTLVLICNVLVPGETQGYDRDPRSIANRALNFIQTSNIADQAYFGPEPEFFIFDNVRFAANQYESYFHVDSSELWHNNSMSTPNASNGFKVEAKGGYLAAQPFDHANDLRSEIMNVIRSIGIIGNLHHHEVSPGQSEVGFNYADLVTTGDNVQKFKYIARNIAASYGKSITFMPKPVVDENGSGMHVHQSLWKGNNNLFAGQEYANLSKIALYYIGGIIRHGKSLNAFTNPTTNSYKRLVPGYEAPVSLAYSACNRSAAIRIPYSSGNKARRIEARFPDAASNPYLCTTALLMAGIDGVINKIEPGEAIEQNLYELSQHKLKKIPSLSTSLVSSLEALERDHEYLLRGSVFSKEFIENYIALKKPENENLKRYPHPIEFHMYYNS